MIKVSQELRAETQALASAGALDGKASAFDDESADLDNMDALTRAIVAENSFLQGDPHGRHERGTGFGQPSFHFVVLLVDR